MSLFDEIKRRNVFRVAAAYVVVGWLILQVSDIVLDFAGAPDWVGKVLIGLLLVGIVPATVLAWLFEVTPDGIKLDDGNSDSDNRIRSQRLDKITIGAVVVLAGMLLWQQLSPTKPTQDTAQESPIAAATVTESTVSGASIAVLPFADLSPAGDQEYFSDGIAEEILNVLVRVEGLSVASRTSAFAFKGQGALGIPAIAEALEVRHVLEGSVRRAGATIRVTAQLIDAETDKHLWSQTYDRELSAENVFAIQDEIASAIVGELATAMSLAPEITETVTVSADTDNLDAYELFLRGRQQFRARNTENILGTIEIFEQAVALDPEFARAWSGLAATRAVAPSWGHNEEDYAKQALDAANRAIELDDALALPYAVLGYLGGRVLPVDFMAAFEHFEKALDRNPDSVNALLWRGTHWIAVGAFERAAQDLNHCLEVDPAYENCRMFLAVANLYAGERALAFSQFEKSAANGGTSQGMVFAYAYASEGDIRSALHTMKWLLNSFRAEIWLDRLFRAVTDPEFDHERERRQLEIEVEAHSGVPLDWRSVGSSIKMPLRHYEDIFPTPSGSVWWHPSFPHFQASPHRKRIMRELGLPDYWRAAGFPPQCRPVGDDDFECDQ